VDVDVAETMIGGHDRAALFNGLGNKWAIERIAVVPFESTCKERMSGGYR
jgi:hypothetical protein